MPDRTASTESKGSAFQRPVFPELPLDVVMDSAAPAPESTKPHRKRTDDKPPQLEQRNARAGGKARRDQGAQQARRYAFRRS